VSRNALFDAIRPFAPERRFDVPHVEAIDSLADMLGIPRDNGRTMSPAGVRRLKAHEGVVLKAYPDPATKADPWTIGVGHTGPDVHKGLIITEAQADELLRKDLTRFEAKVNKLAPKTTQAQFDAMVSLAFNIGEDNFASSTLLRLHNAGDYAGAAAQFGRWNRAANRVMPGLTTRRADEARTYKGETA
jgi:lysozyme